MLQFSRHITACMQTLLFGDRYDHYVPVSLATPLLGLRVRIPRGEMIVSSEFGMGLCVGLITRPEESYRVCVCVCVCLRVIVKPL